jgi:DNA ligase-1
MKIRTPWDADLSPKKKRKKAKKKPAKKRKAKKKPARKKKAKKKAKRKVKKKAKKKATRKKAAKKKKARPATIGSPDWWASLSPAEKRKVKQASKPAKKTTRKKAKKTKKTTRKKAKKTKKTTRKKATKKKATKKKATSLPAMGYVVECIRQGGKIRVRPVAGQGIPVKNVQFPRDLRYDGCQYTVDALIDQGTHYRASGEIRPFEQGLGARKRPKPAPRHHTRLHKPPAMQAAAPGVLLAHKWTEKCDPRGWWISEKLDGVRAYWDGKRFLSRYGNVFHAPKWFTKGLPKVALDGELWAGRGNFQDVTGIVRSHAGGDRWKAVKYLVFDAPDFKGGFEDRLAYVKKVVKKAPYAQAVKHYRCKGPGHMHNELKAVEARGGEGLMIRMPGSAYERKRSRVLLKVKTFHDSEATITGYYPGKGKHEGVIGGFFVETEDGVPFKVGTGLTDAMRADPPPVGTVITYRYQELSRSGRPRFASFVRVRPPE